MSQRVARIFVLAVAALCAQPPAFEVASIKAVNTVTTASDIKRDPAGGLVMTNVNLRAMMITAYRIQPYQLSGGPPLLRNQRFDINAKAPPGLGRDQTWAMLQSLLADRFHLGAHRETKGLPVFDLVVAKGGLKTQPARRDPSSEDGTIQTFDNHVKFLMVPMADVARTLAGILNRPVIDRTNVEGKYDFQVDSAP
jgi:bla regulator protein BlaR1